MKSSIYMPQVLLLDEWKCQRNIKKIVHVARKAKVGLRPHFKTHQSREIGGWFKDMGVVKITVSSTRMAQYFLMDGWKDITHAIPVNINEHEIYNYIAIRCKLNLLFTNSESVTSLNNLLKSRIGAFIKVDVGTHRTGIIHTDFDQIDRTVEAIHKADKMKFAGFLAHAGHSYRSRSSEEILDIHKEYLEHLQRVYNRYMVSFPAIEVSIGDTPTCSVSESFGCATELRPGNFVFYDLMQVRIGSCSYDEIAVALACPVIALHPDRNEAIIHAGGIHLSKDFIIEENGDRSFGELVWLNEAGWSAPVEDCYVSKLSQEHGTLQLTTEVIQKLNVGDTVGILPVHSCMTADAMGGYHTPDGKYVDHLNSKMF